jgi:calcium-translocating P-type ATPase
MPVEDQAGTPSGPPEKASGDSHGSVARSVSGASRSEAQNQTGTVLGGVPVDPSERIDLLMRDLSSAPTGLSASEAQRRMLQWGPNELRRRGGRKWPRELASQLSHPLALLLWLAAGLSFAVGSDTVAIAVLLVIVLNALFAFVQEMQAERAVEALGQYLPRQVTVLRIGEPTPIRAADLVPGDVVVVAEGERIAADMRLISGAVEVDLSTLTGESAPALRSAELVDLGVPKTAAPDLVFSGTNCTGGEARGVVFATGMRTELGRIAALSERVKEEPSPLEAQVRSVAWLIAGIAVAMSVAFVPVAIFGAGLSFNNSVVFAVGLLAGNVPEGLLPVITLALAVAVSGLARRGALVKRLSAVETLGSTDVICTDKTGTLTENRMRPLTAWTVSTEVALEQEPEDPRAGHSDAALTALAQTAAACNNAHLEPDAPATGDPTEVALLSAARTLGADIDSSVRQRQRRHQYNFNPQLKLMSTLDTDDEHDWLHTKGASESVLPRCSTVLLADGQQRPLETQEGERLAQQVDAFAGQGLRVLALAQRSLASGQPAAAREEAERDLCFLGLVTMLDPPRAEAVEAVARCHSAGIRIVVITGDHPLTAVAIARQVGIGGDDPTVFNAQSVDHLDEHEVGQVLAGGQEVIFARASPEAKLQIAEALQRQGHVVAMTGDGVNDAPALRSADIGIAMGRSGTDVAREASTMVLTDDNFATIVVAIEAGRQVYDNVRKFILYIFAHATPEVVPFLVFALSGGTVPLPLTVLQLLAFDVGFETLPSLALGRDPVEPGIMEQPPRPRSEGVIRGPMLVRAWLFLGVMVAGLSLGGYFYVLLGAGWHPGDPVGAGHPLHHAYLQATTMTLLGLIAGQIGTAFAVRTRRASLRSIGILSNRYLLGAIAAELALAGLFVYTPPLQALLGTAPPPAHALPLLIAYPLVVWGADELRRWLLRRRDGRADHAATAADRLLDARA